ncbi:MAG: 23S rRNA (uracil(1939)-C(5))-methyltransferase RlmD [Clostridia bacterium]|nr:23S rRNA (uracil(1939)-C(5))-methyltransferase RlmD [Clostridia bacterium]
MNIKKNEIYNIKITDLGTQGEGIGKIEGYTLFVKNTLPGEEVKVLVVKANKSYGYGKALEIITPSPYRITPPCSFAGKCGGCTIQHLEYSEQLKLKQNKVKQNIMRIGGFNNIEVEPVIGMDEPYHYRNKAQYPVNSDKNGINMGFYSLGSHKIVNNDNCLIGSKENSKILQTIKAFMESNNISAYNEETGKGLVRHILIREGFYTGEIMVCLIVNSNKFKYKKELLKALEGIENLKSVVINYNTVKSNVIMGQKCETIWGQDYITDKIGDLAFKISSLSFFQVNPIQTYKLYSKALEFADLKGNETVIDAYCGIGSISLFLAQKAKKVYGIEIVPDAIENATENAKLNNIKNAEFFAGKSEDIVPELYNERGIKADVMVVDPPRKGCDESLLKLMLNMKPERIVYVSCDSATLARDLKILCESSVYNIEKVQPVDMFPHSYHVETVCLLTRKAQ